MGRWHADAVRRTGGRVAVVVDPDASRAEALARTNGGVPVASVLDAAALARAARVAHVCTPLASHEEIVGELVDAGVHVIAEKPLTERAEATASLLDRASARGVLLCPVHQFVFQDGVRRLVRAAASLAPIRHVVFEACSAGAQGGDDDAQDRLVAEVLPHPLSLLVELLAEPVAALEWRAVRPAPGELRAVAVSGGVTIDVLVSTHARPTTNVLRVMGEHGSATADLFHGYAVVQGGRVSRARKVAQPLASAGLTGLAATTNLARRTWRREPAYPGLRELVRAFHAAAASGGPSPISAEATLDVARARDRLLDAAGLRL
jgi:predicted dehydrogenase